MPWSPAPRYAPYGSLDEYMQLGYVPVDHDDEAASKTIEYAFDDWTIARMAAAMKHTETAGTFTKRAANWRNNFNAKDGFVEPVLPMASIAFRSILRRQAPAAASPKAMPGSTPGISRRMCRA